MTQEEVNFIYDSTRESMDASLEHLQNELLKLRTGKASTAMLSGILVSYYGSMTPLNQVANVSTADARTLVIQPWEKSMLGPVEKAIFEANLGLTPQNDGEMIRINIPPLTEERRRDLVKKAKALGEDTRVGMRSARREAMDSIKQAVKDGYPEDAGKRSEEKVEEITKKYNEKINQILESKEKDIMTI